MEIAIGIIASAAALGTLIIGIIVIRINNTNRKDDKNLQRCNEHKKEFNQEIKRVEKEYKIGINNLKKDITEDLLPMRNIISEHSDKLLTLIEHNLMIQQLIQSSERIENKLERLISEKS